MAADYHAKAGSATGPATIATLDGTASVAFMSGGRRSVSDGMDCRVLAFAPRRCLHQHEYRLAGQSHVPTRRRSAAAAYDGLYSSWSMFLRPALPLASVTMNNGSDARGHIDAGSHNVMAVTWGTARTTGRGQRR